MYSSSFAVRRPTRAGRGRGTAPRSPRAAAAAPARPYSRTSRRIRGDEDAALAQHCVAGEAHTARDQRKMVGGVARSRHRLEGTHPQRRPRASRRPRRAPPASGAGRGGAAASCTASEWSAWSCVSTTPPSPPRASTPRSRRSRCAASAGPGSTTHAGPRPTTQVFVPDSVIGPGFEARTRTMSWPLRSPSLLDSESISSSGSGADGVLTVLTLADTALHETLVTVHASAS